MAFDPDTYLEEEGLVQKPQVESAEFDPDAYLASETKDTTKRMTRRGARPVRETPPQFEYAYGESLFEPPEETAYDDLVQPENLDVMKTYLSNPRFGKLAENIDTLSPEDIRSRFMTTMRMVDANPELNGAPELLFLLNAPQDQKEDAIRAHQLFESVPGFAFEGGSPVGEAMADYIAGVASSPSTATSLAVGTAFAPGPGTVAGAATGTLKTLIAQQGIRAGIREVIKRTGAGLAARKKAMLAGSLTEAGLEVPASVLRQKIDIETLQRDEEGKLKTEIDPIEVFTDTAIASTLGLLAGAQTARKEGVAELERKLASKRTPEGFYKAQRRSEEDAAFLEAFEKQYDKVSREYDIHEGRKRLDEVGKPTDLTNSKIRNDVNQRAIDIAKYVMLKDPAFRPKQNEQVTDAIVRVFKSIGADEIDDDLLVNAMAEYGLTKTDFVQMVRASATDTAQYLNTLSQFSKYLNTLKKEDPEVEKLLKRYETEEGMRSSWAIVHDMLKRVVDESRAFVVASLGTTVRNGIGTSSGMTLTAGARFVDNLLYQSMAGVKAAVTGKASLQGTKEGLSNIIGNSFSDFYYLKNQDLTKNITEQLLKDDPKINQMLFHQVRDAAGEEGQQRLSRAARFVNTFNMAQDAFFRRAIFTASVERQMKSTGADMFEYLANDKNIPKEVLKRAADDALKGTFSYMPKEGSVNNFIRGIEKSPFASIIIPFPRFMANSMRFTYEYMPYIKIPESLGNIGRSGWELLAKRDPKKADILFKRATEDAGKLAAGAGAVYAAYTYRQENPDIPWGSMEMADGSTIDMRPVFPFNVFLGVAELQRMIERNDFESRKLKEIFESLAGFKMPAGTTESFLSGIADAALDISEGLDTLKGEKLKEKVGAFVGDFVGRFFQPLQPVFALMSDFNRDSGVAVDPNVPNTSVLVRTLKEQGVLDEKDEARFLEGVSKRIEAKIPGAPFGVDIKEGLPIAKERLRPETPIRGAEFFSVATGLRMIRPDNPIEKEFERLELNEYRMFGSSGVREYDRALIDEAMKPIQQQIGKLIQSDRYLRLEDAAKKELLANRTSSILKNARTMLDVKFRKTNPDAYYKMKWNKLSKRQQNAANALYSRDNPGRTIEEDNAYKNAVKYEALIKQFK